MFGHDDVEAAEAGIGALEALAGVEPACLEGSDAARLVELFARAEKVAAAGRTRMAARAAQCHAHREEGDASAERWLARTAGTTPRKARETLETAERLKAQPEVDEAFRAGDLSAEQATIVSEAAEADPRATGDLLETARDEPVSKLRNKARAVKAARDDDRLGRWERQRRARRVHHGVDETDGMTWLHAAWQPDVGVAVVNRLEVEADRRYRQLTKEERRTTSHRQLLADTLAALVLEGGSRPHATRADVVVHVDWPSLLRGHPHRGERCHVQGAGPVPVAAVDHLLAGSAFLTGVLVEGTEIAKVKRFGTRRRPADLQAALDARSVVRDGDVACVDCGNTLGLEWDHDDPAANHGPTSSDNLDPRCRPDHRHKTERDREAGLLKSSPLGLDEPDARPPPDP